LYLSTPKIKLGEYANHGNDLDDRMERITKWLSTVDPHTRHREICSKRVEDTGGWFFKIPEFQTWRDLGSDSCHGVENRVLGCYGNPGVGKSFIR
jgi:hypothetical protein